VTLTAWQRLAFRLPRALHDVAVRITTLDADVASLIAFFDEFDAVRGKAIS
jgi:hypothetical protein